MHSIDIGNPGAAACKTPRNAMRKRAAKAVLAAIVFVGGGLVWQHVSSERTAARAEQARTAALQMTDKKWQALAREEAIAAAAQAFAERHAAQQAAEAQRRAGEQARLQAQKSVPQKKG